MFLSTCLRIIYGDDYERERHRVMAKYGFKSKKQQSIICAPRRFGKTFSVAFFTVVVAIVLPDIEISIFSPGKRQSVALMNHIFTFMKKLNEDDRVIQKNEEKMRVRTLNGRESKINAYPSAVKTLKGVSGTIIILEECAAIDPAVLFEVVCPLHQLDITALIAISTITTDDNFFTKYTNMKDKNGDDLFSVRHVYLSCEPCRDKGPEVAAKCSHNNISLPGWSSARKRRTVNNLMAGQEDMLAREIGGIANAKFGKAFNKKFINQLMDAPRYVIDRHGVDYPVLFFAVDPNAGGKNSHFAICTSLNFRGTTIIVGLESFPTKSAKENHQIIVEHAKRFATLDHFYNTLKVFILESNLGFESQHIAGVLQDNLSRTLVMNEKDGRTGFLTTNPMKTQAVEKTRLKLAEGSFAIANEDNFVCISQPYNKIVGMFATQLGDFAEMIKEFDYKNPTKTFAGKHVGPDDMVMTLLMTVMWTGFFYNNDAYLQYL